jgi:hypothetical protein
MSAVRSGELEMHLASYDGLAVGDVIEISSGAPAVKVVVIERFG